MKISRKTIPTFISALLLAAVVLLSVNGNGPASADEAAAGGTAAAAAPTPANDPFFGVMTQNPMSTDDFNTLEWSRIGSYRLPIAWQSVEDSGDGNFDWDNVDRIVELTSQRGIRMLPTFYSSPSWLTYDKRQLPIWSGYAIDAWKDLLRAAVERYGNRGTFWHENPDLDPMPITNWQIWNEPNIRNFAQPVSPAAYGKLLRISAPVIRGADPKAKVVTAGLYGKPPTGTGIDSARFLNRLFKVKGFRRSFDVAAVHPYASSFRGSLKRIWPIRHVLDRHGNRNKRIDITELGWGSDATTAFGKGSTSAQARQVKYAYRALLRHRNRLHLKSVYWFSWKDLPDDARACSFCFRTGLFDQDGNPKPSWFSMLQFTHGV